MFPRMLHKDDGSQLVVHDQAAMDAALADGWGLHPVCQEPFECADPGYVLPEGPIYGRERETARPKSKKKG
jgi:hypothetical protein